MNVTPSLAKLRDATAALIASNDPDLTSRQLGVLLIIATEDGPHTVRGLAARLNVSKPAITRAFDRLSELELMRRKIDQFDRRSCNALVTPKGFKYVEKIQNLLNV